MNVSYDATTIDLTKGGTTVYLTNLIENLRKIDPKSNFDLHSIRQSVNKSGLTRKIETIYREFYWREYKLPKIARRNMADLIHFPNHLSAYSTNIPTIITYHDIYILNNPEAFPYGQALYSRKFIPKMLRNASKIIAVSQFTKNEIIKYLDIEESKIHVIHNGVNSLFRFISNQETLDLVMNKYQLPKNFILYVGAIEPRKNVDKLVKAFDLVRKDCEIDLVIVSFGGWKNENVIKLIELSSYKKHIHLIGYVDDIDLPVLYNLAKVFVYPSAYEGFGLPLLESMACGCPLIGTENTVANEIVGCAGVLINPNDIVKLKESMLNLLEESNLIKYRNLGLERSKQFSWVKCANQTLELYKSLQ